MREIPKVEQWEMTGPVLERVRKFRNRNRDKYHHQRQISRHVHEAWATDRRPVAIMGVVDGFRGVVGFYALKCDLENQVACLTYGVFESYQRRGFGIAIAKASIEGAMARGMARVEAEVLSNNFPSQAAILAAGFVFEGERKAAVLTADGSRVGSLMYGIVL